MAQRDPDPGDDDERGDRTDLGGSDVLQSAQCDDDEDNLLVPREKRHPTW